MKLQTKDVKYDILSLSSNKRRFFRVNFLINVAFEDAAFISLFPSQMRRLLKEGVNKRAVFKRGNTVLIKQKLSVYYYLSPAPETDLILSAGSTSSSTAG